MQSTANAVAELEDDPEGKVYARGRWGAGRRLSTTRAENPVDHRAVGGEIVARSAAAAGAVAADGSGSNNSDFTGNYKLAPRFLLAATGRRGASSAIVFRRSKLTRVLNSLQPHEAHGAASATGVLAAGR